ncbi:MAG: hypothetical protein HRU38_08805, partial [Saccharospirillaceae bacterium]|nr:hypothetical protein [Pseudomonadales bacterium]NRB78753.1 hypothetical protein [Saccharospirillaceae bacterium]
MTNNNQFNLGKLSAAILLASGLALSSCSNSDDSAESTDTSTETTVDTTAAPIISTNTTDGTFSTINNPVGSVSGLVQDTNGNPIADATIYIGNQTTTTNAGGLYYFEDVKVANSAQYEDGPYSQNELTVSIVPPAGYLGATVTVNPQAQITGGNAGIFDEVIGSSDSNTVFIDGFVAEAGAAVLPALTAEASGTLRNSTSYEALADVVLTLDLLDVGYDNNAQEQSIGDVGVTYATSSFTATTDAAGNFTFIGLPADAQFTINASNFDITTEINTSNEHGANGVEVLATPFESTDTVKPYITNVVEVSYLGATRGLLDDDFSTVLTIEFSETIDATLVDQSNSVVIRDVDSNSYVVNTAAVVGNTLTITLDTAIPVGNMVDVWLLTDDFRDTAGNVITVSEDIVFDSSDSTSTKSQHVKLQLQTFEEANQNATSPTQIQLTADTTGMNQLEVIQDGFNASNLAYITFLDVADNIDGIQQLNSPEASARLSNLLEEIADTINASGVTDVDTNYALVSFATTNASYYTLSISDEDSDYSIIEGASQEEGAIVADDGAVTITVLLDDVMSGDTVTVTPFDDFGYAGTENIITLVDNVAPTTILQNSYGMGKEETGSVTSTQYGNGGEQADIASVNPGIPYLDLTPRLLTNVDGTSNGPTDDWNDVRSFNALYANNAVNSASSNNTAPMGEQFINETTKAYDATAFAAYVTNTDFSRTIAVAFSEDVAKVEGTDPVFTAVGTAQAPTNFVVNNNVTTTDDSDYNYNADLINFDIANIYNFALQESGSVLDFTGAIQDLANNIASETVVGNITLTDNAKVVFRDMIPALVTSAVYDGRTFTVKFDKAIDTEALLDVSIYLSSTQITFDDTNLFTWDATTNTLVANLDDYSIITSSVFNLAKFDDVTPDLDVSVASDSIQYAHAYLDFTEIANINGATWDDYYTFGEGHFDIPTFAATNVIKDFSETVTNSALGGSTITVTYEFSHEISLIDNVLNSNEIAAMFTWSGGTVLPDGNTLVITELVNGGSRLAFTLELSTSSTALDTLDASFSRVSKYDGLT